MTERPTIGKLHSTGLSERISASTSLRAWSTYRRCRLVGSRMHVFWLFRFPPRESSAVEEKVPCSCGAVSACVAGHNSLEFSGLGRNPCGGIYFATTVLGRCPMLACSTLRIDPGDGSPAVDYRIEDDRVESRTLKARDEQRRGAVEQPWQRLTPEQLSTHIMAGTVVARWLSRRIGVHRLVRMCNQDSSLTNC
jgi:hypothetical protein